MKALNTTAIKNVKFGTVTVLKRAFKFSFFDSSDISDASSWKLIKETSTNVRYRVYTELEGNSFDYDVVLDKKDYNNKRPCVVMC